MVLTEVLPHPHTTSVLDITLAHPTEAQYPVTQGRGTIRTPKLL
jgi:hypothetical protein